MRTRHRTPRPAPIQTRRSIASLAARIMAEDGIDDYGAAKRKAARQLHLPDTESLPTNTEVETELRAYQALYQRDEQQARIAALRQVAVRTMRILKDFSPYLTGHVLDGTAGRYATVDLILYTDAVKDVELFLLGRGIAYRHVEPRRPAPDGAEIQIEFEMDGVPVRVAALAADQERLKPRNPHSGRSCERASLAALESLLGAAS